MRRQHRRRPARCGKMRCSRSLDARRRFAYVRRWSSQPRCSAAPASCRPFMCDGSMTHQRPERGRSRRPPFVVAGRIEVGVHSAKAV